MNTQNPLIFSLYTPFRNQIRKYNLIDSLYVIWGYSRNFTFNLPFPDDIERPKDFSPTADLNVRRFRGIPEFEQEFLLREFILNCDPNSTKDSLKQKANLAKLVNYLRHDFSEEIDKHFNIPGDFLMEFNRMTHRQFNWQAGYNQKIIFRYYKLYSDAAVSSLIYNKFYLTTFELFVIGFFLFRLTAEQFLTNLPFKSTTHLITNEMIERFFENFSMTVEQAKLEIKASQQMNENIFYSYNPLLARPILIHNNAFMCPIQLLLFWQVTGGIYYSIIKEQGFENAFGNSFQNYIGEVLTKCVVNPNLKVLKEEIYGKEEKRTTDWIMVDDTAILFIECKAKRMTMVSKSELDITKGLGSDLKKMASFITQLYKTFVDYTNGKYPQLAFDSTKKFIPLVVTLEPWYINLNPMILTKLRELVIESLTNNKLDISLVDTYPYHIRATEDFERDIQLINALGIFEYFDKISRSELNEYIKSFKFYNPFEGELERIFFEPLRQKNKTG